MHIFNFNIQHHTVEKSCIIDYRFIIKTYLISHLDMEYPHCTVAFLYSSQDNAIHETPVGDWRKYEIEPVFHHHMYVNICPRFSRPPICRPLYS